VDAPLYLRNEARVCLQLAQAEAHPEVKLILMGMALGWLNLADEMKRPVNLQLEVTGDMAWRRDRASIRCVRRPG
jgi:hypothetical protein